MSGVGIIRYLLANNAPLVAVVPAARIKRRRLPQNTTYPAITVSKISGRQHNNLAMASAQYLVTDRVQVSVHTSMTVAGTTPESQAEAILALVRAALPLSRGVVSSITCDAVIPDIEGPELEDHESQTLQQSQDYLVTFHR